MKSPHMETFNKILKILVAGVYLYAGASKLANVPLFTGQLDESPLIPEVLLRTIAIGLPVLMLGLGAGILFTAKSLYLWGAFSLLIFFTMYLMLLYMLYTPPPCSCAGILGETGYTGHIIFNLILLSVTLWLLLKS